MPLRTLMVLYCCLIDFHEEDYENCEYIPSNGTYNLDNCYTCQIPGEFFFRAGFDNDYSAPGLITSTYLWAAVGIVGMFGTVANILVITVLRRRKKKTSFDFLLCVLAICDLNNSITGFLAGTVAMFFYRNWYRGLISLILYVFLTAIFYLGKSGSAYLTVLITIERYLVIAHPLKARMWLTTGRTKMMTATLLIMAALMNAPRWSGTRWSYNYHGQNVPNLAGKEYIILLADEPEWYQILAMVHVIDSLVPFPLLIIFNTLLFVKISNFTRCHLELTKRQKIDIRAARMFVPVVVVLFICNVPQIMFYISLRTYRVIYVEMGYILYLSIGINSSVNLPIYYMRGSTFAEEIRSVLPGWMQPCFCKPSNKQSEIGGVGSSSSQKSSRTSKGSRTSRESHLGTLI